MKRTTYTQCSHCGELNQQPAYSCKCGKVFEAYRQQSNLAIHMFPSGMWEHLDAEPLYIRDRKQLVDEASARGLTPNYTNPGPTMKELRESGRIPKSARYH